MLCVLPFAKCAITDVLKVHKFWFTKGKVLQ